MILKFIRDKILSEWYDSVVKEHELDKKYRSLKEIASRTLALYAKPKKPKSSSSSRRTTA